MKIDENIQKFIAQPLTHQLLLSLLSDYKRPNDKINDLVKQGKLIPLKRGFYVWHSQQIPELFNIANALYAPSYISADTALSFRGLIPERVLTVVSMSLLNSKLYRNSLGNFEYRKLPTPYYSFGIKREQLRDDQFALVATAEKALFDKIIITPGLTLRSVIAAKKYLIENSRIDEEQLKLLDLKTAKTWLSEAPKKLSLKYLIKAIETL